MEFRPYGDFGGGDFRVATFLACGLAAQLDDGIAAGRRRIIGEDIERMLAGMKTAAARDDVAIVLVALADLVLESLAVRRAGEVLVEAFVSRDGRLGCGRRCS
ncbi:MAG: hypothetical protein EOR57_05710 [Mesorhizobium sp.]|uniref:hypothetical protein n=1 Tax=Mesorhizobium sp. TaxID=1871066 RepID=UPI000FE4F9EE|nr:hypothetical protein [Mesorhizobium sp.]RWL21935.1 MAG: hypothetical protein EOR57_05710 [Mesorhizobium sp.]